MINHTIVCRENFCLVAVLQTTCEMMAVWREDEAHEEYVEACRVKPPVIAD